MLEITVQTENGERHVRPSAEALAALVHRIGGAGDRFLVLQRVPDLPEVFAQVWHETGGAHDVEHRDGARTGTSPRRPTDPAPWSPPSSGGPAGGGWDAGLAWSPLDLPPAGEVPPLDLADDERTSLEQRVREVLAGGYASRADLAQLAEDHLVTKDRKPVSPEQARALADRLWLERVAEQSSWRGETDPERLTRAFTALEDAGITARENFTCCRTCGNAEIGDEAEPGARGFVYFHTQSTDAAAAGHGLTLQYGGFDGTAETTTAVGDEVVAALHAAGLTTRWDRNPGQTIAVTPLDWRRRLIG
ncbi:DUF6891 domain-containing protein [Lentzea guizhouensis]|uniref:DUF6891 domain-containing protein n=1 Tax=Lentzea guizhouensis TaxID=1586287 RepID=UPI0012B6A51D|nr:hypothetical protein [Lentzea guizhouensis]